MTLTARRLPGSTERPTAPQPATDDVGLVQSSERASVRASASPLSLGDEPRWSAPRPGRERREIEEPCVCGGPEIVAASDLPADIVAAVQRHQVEPVHIAYDEAHGIPLSEAQLRARAIDGAPYRSTFGGFS